MPAVIYCIYPAGHATSATAKMKPITITLILFIRSPSRRHGRRYPFMIPVVGSMAMAIGYTVVMGWILKYAIGAFPERRLRRSMWMILRINLAAWHLRLEIMDGRF